MSQTTILKLFSLGIFLSFLCCYLEWGPKESGFLFQMEYYIFFSKRPGADTLLHPFIAIPLAGQLLTLVPLFQPKPSRKLIIIAWALLAILPLFILFIGLLSLNLKITLSAVPFAAVSISFFLLTRKARRSTGVGG